MKRIVIASDGTWNSPENKESTNVLKLAQTIAPQSNDSTQQVIFYDWGVGSDRKKLSGGISGAGIDKNIMDCYRFIVQNYDKGDELFFFGFSRGAYTVRSLAGMIRNCGVLKREHARYIPKAFDLYRERGRKSAPDESEAKELRAQYCVADQTSIEFIGVWDTVGTLGIPFSCWGLLGNESKYLFHDTSPSRIVKFARHALSIDETREDFMPVLWDEDKSEIDLKQVWFAGVHGDVGGGYGDDHQLGDTACAWLLDEAAARGLVIEAHGRESLQPSSAGKQHNEYKGIYKFREKSYREIGKESLLHCSVKERFEKMGASYRSPTLRKFLELHNNDWSSVNIVS